MLSLSVVHHIDNYAAEKAGIPEGADRVPHTMAMLSNLLKLSPMHIIELPDKPWISHIHDVYNNDPRAILEAVCQGAGGEWEMRKIYENAWIGHRELWLLRRSGPRQPSMPASDATDNFAPWRKFFPMLIPSKDPAFLEWLNDHAAVIDSSPRQLSKNGDLPLNSRISAFADADVLITDSDKLPLEGTHQCLQEVLFGEWQNAAGERIQIRQGPGAIESCNKSSPPCVAQYKTKGTHPICWATEGVALRGVQKESSWVLSNHGGDFKLKFASKSAVVWSRGGDHPYTTSW